jgi:hypothetical protein
MKEELVHPKKCIRKSKCATKNKKGVNDLMHMSLKQMQMLMTFDKYKLLLLYDNNLYIYIYIEICC